MNHLGLSQLLLCFLSGVVMGLAGCWMLWTPIQVIQSRPAAGITCSLTNVQHGSERQDSHSNPDRQDTENGSKYTFGYPSPDLTRIHTAPGSNNSPNKTVNKAHDDVVSEHNVRVLCWIMTQPQILQEKAVHVNRTWGRRCDTLLFVSDVPDPSFPTINITVEHGRDHLTAKTMRAFDYIYAHYFHAADWFLKADDDTYVIMENLRYMLKPHSPSEPVFFGQHFRMKVQHGYFSGGAGYVLSREALRRLGSRAEGQCAEDHGYEDVEMGKCMEKLGVVAGETRDALNRTRFHCLTLNMHAESNYPEWYHLYTKYRAEKGPAGMSDLPISFHYVSPKEMYIYEYLVYRLRPQGFQYIQMDLNPQYVNYSLVTLAPPGLSGSGKRGE